MSIISPKFKIYERKKKKKHINDIAYLRREAYKLARLMNKFCDTECDFFFP